MEIKNINKINITIDGKQVEVLKDTYLLKAMNELGIDTPTLCYHKDLTPGGTCRLCTVEVETRGKKNW